MTNAKGICGCLVLVLSLCSWPCRAQGEDAAKERFKAAMKLIEKEDYPAALAEFEASFKLDPRPVTQLNIAMCLKAMYRYTESVRAFKRYLDLREPDEEKRKAAEEAIEQMEQMVSKLWVVDAPEGAAVKVDGKMRGRAPQKNALILDPGQHTVEVSMLGYAPLQTEVKLVSGAELRVRAALEPVKQEAAASAATPPSSPSSSPPPPPEPESQERKPSKALLIAGIATAAAGAVGLGLGTYGVTEGKSDEKRGKEAKELDDYESYEDIRVDQLPRDRAFEIAGYAAGGALVAAGAVLIVLRATKQNKERPPTKAALRIDPRGVSVTW